MIENIAPIDAERLTRITSLVNELSNILEDMRPAGGWTQRLDKKYCSECCQEKPVK